jgi:hypothetical protein
MKILVSACLVASCLCGQSGKLAAPSAGLVFDRSAHTLRRIQGIPGAAVVGAPVEFGMVVSAAYVSPRLDSAVVLGEDGTAHFFQLTADAPLERRVDSLGTPQRVVFSPSGTAAALYSPGSVRVIKGLPDAPVVTGNISLRNGQRIRRQVPYSLAVSDDGAHLLYAAGGPVELIGVAGNSRQVMPGSMGALTAFAPGSHDAAIVHAGKLFLFQDIAGAATERNFDGISAPSAVAFSPDSQRVFVASTAGRTITAFRVATGERSDLTCDCAPESLIPMGSFFRLTELSGEPLWLLDAVSDRGLVFVPAPAAN